MALTITVNGGGTFTASMEEGPVSFTASLAAVGPAGPAGPGIAVGGTTGQVLAKASGTDYDTEWVARNPFDQSLNTTDVVQFQSVGLGGGTSLNDDELNLVTGMVIGSTIAFPDSTVQTTALPSGLADGYIVEWNADTSTYLSVPNDARTLFITARNITGTTIPKGSVVLITGASGNRPTIGLAQGNTSANADGVIGITAAAINNNANGRVITEGLASNLDTSAFAAGDKLYLSATTPGGLVNVRPVQPAHSVAVGVVTRSNPSVGSIEVRVQVGEHLEFLHDVLLTSNTNLDLLAYETSSGLWKNKSFSTLGLLTSATAASTYLTTSTAASTYLTQSNAAATYQTLSGMSAYLTTSAAAATYYPLTGNPSGFLVSGDLSGYLLSSTAATTYAPIVHTHTASQVTDFDTAADARVNALVPAASTTAAGKVELATDAEAQRGVSTSLAVTPANVRAAINNVAYNGTSIAAVANGGSTNANVFDGFTLITSATVANSSARRLSSTNSNSVFPASIPGHGIYRINFAKTVAIRWAIGSSVTTGTGNQFQFAGFFVGQNNDIFTFTNQECANIGFGFALYPDGNMKISARNASGVTTATVASGIPMVRTYAGQQPATEVVQYSDGAGNLYTYIDGVLVNTITAGPTTVSDVGSSPFAMWCAGLTNGTATPTAAHSFVVSYPKLYLGQ